MYEIQCLFFEDFFEENALRVWARVRQRNISTKNSPRFPLWLNTSVTGFSCVSVSKIGFFYTIFSHFSVHFAVLAVEFLYILQGYSQLTSISISLVSSFLDNVVFLNTSDNSLKPFRFYVLSLEQLIQFLYYFLLAFFLFIEYYSVPLQLGSEDDDKFSRQRFGGLSIRTIFARRPLGMRFTWSFHSFLFRLDHLPSTNSFLKHKFYIFFFSLVYLVAIRVL